MRVIMFNGLKLCFKLFFNYFQNKNGIRIKIQVDDFFRATLMVGISSCNEVGSERWIDEVLEDILVISWPKA